MAWLLILRYSKGCSVDAVHAPLVAGITAGPQGAYSVAMSGGYDDDVDEGYALSVLPSGSRGLR
jgi:E3 ubiquitin-protein ligase UHRF1